MRSMKDRLRGDAFYKLPEVAKRSKDDFTRHSAETNHQQERNNLLKAHEAKIPVKAQSPGSPCNWA